MTRGFGFVEHLAWFFKDLELFEMLLAALKAPGESNSPIYGLLGIYHHPNCQEFAFCRRPLKEPLGRTGGRGLPNPRGISEVTFEMVGVHLAEVSLDSWAPAFASSRMETPRWRMDDDFIYGKRPRVVMVSGAWFQVWRRAMFTSSQISV
jgi:hypothetical protein